jgi:hypothetical protein
MMPLTVAEHAARQHSRTALAKSMVNIPTNLYVVIGLVLIYA